MDAYHNPAYLPVGDDDEEDPLTGSVAGDEDEEDPLAGGVIEDDSEEDPLTGGVTKFAAAILAMMRRSIRTSCSEENDVTASSLSSLPPPVAPPVARSCDTSSDDIKKENMLR